ncbi:MAG: hypothetical protein WA144_04190 [Candidatus Methanoperedens sp.]
MKSKIILMLVISSLIIGCIDAPKSISSNNEIPDTISSITEKLLGDCNGKLTTQQCDYWVENSINNKYVRWSGTVSDVKDGVVYVNVNFEGKFSGVATVALYDIPNEKLMDINIGSNIQFTGKINIKKDYSMIPGYSNSWILMTSDGGILGHVDLYNSKIISPDNTELSIKSNTQSGISSVTPTEPSITSGISPVKSGELPKSKTFDVSYVKINDSYIQINVKNIGKESVSNFNFNIGSQRSLVLGNLNPGNYLSAVFNIKEILGKDNNIDIWINYVWSNHPNSEVLRIPITT